MIGHERRELILRELRARGSVSVVELAQRHGVATITVRRDLALLAEEGLLTRIHGGATVIADEGERPVNAVSAGSKPTRGVPELPVMARGRGRRGGLTIGMVAPSASYYYPPLIRGAEEVVRSEGSRLVLGISNYSPVEERRQIERLLANGVDGLLITPSKAAFADGPTLDLLASADVPVVVVERSLDDAPPVGNLEGVRTDHVAGAELAVAYLAELGHRRVVLAVRKPATPTVQWIVEGYQRAVARLGLEPWQIFELSTAAEGEAPDFAAIDELLDGRGEDPCAVLVHRDEEASQLVRRALELDLDIPADLVVVSYDDEIAEFAQVPLTAVSPPKYEVGFTAASMCFQRLQTKAAQAGQMPLRRLRLVPTLKVRASTSFPR